MKTLIIALPRTGSTNYMHQLAKERVASSRMEPMHIRNADGSIFSVREMTNVVVKTILRLDTPVSDDKYFAFLLNAMKEYDEIILLTRRDLKACAESWAYFKNNKAVGYESTGSYVWKSNKGFDGDYYQIRKLDNELKHMSRNLGIPLIYYEDIFDQYGPQRQRLDARPDFKTSIL